MILKFRHSIEVSALDSHIFHATRDKKLGDKSYAVARV